MIYEIDECTRCFRQIPRVKEVKMKFSCQISLKILRIKNVKAKVLRDISFNFALLYSTLIYSKSLVYSTLICSALLCSIRSILL